MAALADAVLDDLLVTNPCASVRAPVAPSRVADALTLEEAQRMIAVARQERLGVVVGLGLLVGLRRGEALALHWSDVDLEASTLRISGTLKWVPRDAAEQYPHPEGWPRGLVLDTPKTEASWATITMPETLTEWLRSHRRLQAQERLFSGEHWKANDLVACTPFGGPVDPSAFLKLVHKWSERADLGRIRFHALRHTTATLAREHDVPLDAVAATARGQARNAFLTCSFVRRVGLDPTTDGLKVSPGASAAQPRVRDLCLRPLA